MLARGRRCAGCQNVGPNLSSTATSAVITLPTATSATGDYATVEYIDSMFRTIWTSPAGSF